MKDTKQSVREKIKEAVSEYWNEHDGDHFYKDELEEMVLELSKEFIARVKEEDARMMKEVAERMAVRFSQTRFVTKIDSEIDSFYLESYKDIDESASRIRSSTPLEDKK